MRTAKDNERPALIRNSVFIFSNEEQSGVAMEISDRDLALISGEQKTGCHDCHCNIHAG
jgi:hypothetical protein